MIIDQEHKEFYTDKQQETTYLVGPNNLEVLTEFFEEILERKKDDPYEGGLQASGVIFNGVAAFKINEDDGLAPHSLSFVNLVKEIEYKFDKTKPKIYATRDLLSRFKYYSEEQQKICKYATELRIVSAEDYMQITFLDRNEELSDFKKQVILKIAKLCRQAKEDCQIGEIYFGYSTKYHQADFTDISHEDYVQLKTELTGEKDKNFT